MNFGKIGKIGKIWKIVNFWNFGKLANFLGKWRTFWENDEFLGKMVNFGKMSSIGL